MSSEDRIGQNQAAFRNINERIEAGQWPGERSEPVAFRCECAALGCNMLVELTLAAYERVRARPRHFVLVAGHEIVGVDVIIEREGQYVVVEKVGEAGRVAEASDPRSE